jgi:hypothetical protein
MMKLHNNCVNVSIVLCNSFTLKQNKKLMLRSSDSEEKEKISKKNKR